MQDRGLSDAVLPRLTRFIAEQMGLHFPPERRADLERGLAGAAGELGLKDAGACAEWLLSGAADGSQLNALASHLTVGETYFFREPKTLAALANQVLPELIGRRRGGDRHLRLWSAACCTGEEPYSLAILLKELLPDWREWRVTILATDINERFLEKAAQGIYGEWSFRDSPPGYKERYFTQVSKGRYAVLQEIKACVNFAHLNLAQDAFPALATGTTGLDVILCRNVLIYFTPAQGKVLVEKLRRSLVDEGWLAVSPSECSQVLFARFATVNFPGAILYRKSAVEDRSRPHESGTAPPARIPLPWSICTAGQNIQRPQIPIQMPETPARDAAPPPESPFTAFPESMASDPPSNFSDPLDAAAMTRARANEGNLTEALTWSGRWLESNKLDSAAHYLHAMILQELGERDRAVTALKRTVYLDPGFALAHFALGNLARGEARSGAADKHFANTLHALRGCAGNEVLPESDGLTAGRLREIIDAFIAAPRAAVSSIHGASVNDAQRR